MADFNNDQLLLALGIDLSPLKQAASQAESILDALEAHWNQVAKQGTKDTTAVAQAATQVSQAQQKVKSAVQQVVSQTQAAVTSAKQQASAQQLNVDILKQHINEATLLTKQTEAQTAALKMQTQQQELLLSQIRRERAEKAGEKKEGGTAASARLLTGFAKGALGENVFGEVAAGVLAGEGIGAAIEGASHALQEFISHLRELSVESGSVVQLQSVFNRLAATLNTTGPDLLSHMRVATEGLADNFTLMRTGLMALTSSYKISIPVLEQFLHDTVTVAEASGVSATHALDALRQAFTLGRPQTLSAALGMETFRNITEQIPPVLKGAAKTAAEWNMIMGEVHRRAVAFGDLPPTLEKAGEQFEVLKKNLDLAFGTGFNQSQGISAFTHAIDVMNSKMPQLTANAMKFGATIGDVVGKVAEALSGVLNILSKIPANAILFGGITAGAGLAARAITFILGPLVSMGAAIGRFALAQQAALGPTVEETTAVNAEAAAMERDAVATNEAAVATGRLAVANEGAATKGLASAGGLGVATRATGALGEAALVAIPILMMLGADIEDVRRKTEQMSGTKPGWVQTFRGIRDGIANEWAGLWVENANVLHNFIHGDMIEQFAGAMHEIAAVMTAPGFWHGVVDGMKRGLKDVGQILTSPITGFPKDLTDHLAKMVQAEQGKDADAARKAQADALVLYKQAKNEFTSAEIESQKASALATSAYGKVLAANAAKGSHPTQAQITAENVAQKAYDEANELAEKMAAKTGEAHNKMLALAPLAGVTQEEMASDPKLQAYLDFERQRGAMMTPGQEAQIAKQQASAALEHQKLELETKKQTLAAEKQMDDEDYAAGITSFKEHQDQLKDIALQTKQAAIDENANNAAIQIRSINAQSAMLPRAELDAQIAKARDAQKAADQQAEIQYNATIHGLRMSDLQDAVKVAEEKASATEAVEQKRIQAQLNIDRQLYQGGEITGTQYTANQILAQQKLAELAIEKAQAIYNAGPKSESAGQTYIKAVETAVADGQAKISEIYEQETATQVAYIERVYGVQQKAIDAQLNFNKQFGGGMPVGGVTNETLLYQGIDSVQKQIQDFEDTFTTMNAKGEQFSDDWWKVVDGTEAAMTKLIGYNDELAETLALTTPIGNIFSSLGKGIEGSVGNPKAKNAGMVIASAGQQLENVAKMQQQMHRLQKGVTLDPVQQQMLDMSTHVSSTFTQTADSFSTTTDKVKTALDQLADVVNQVKNKISGAGSGTAASDTSGTPWAGAGAADGLGLGPFAGGSTAQDVIDNQDKMAVEEPIFQGTIENPSAPQLPSSAYGSGGMSTAADGLNQFAAKLQLAVQTLTGFVSTITQAQTPLAGAIGGGISGGGVGQEIQSAGSGMGGSIGQAMNGALGQAMPFIGAAVGMLLGGIMGQKNAVVQEELQDLKTAFNQMQQAFSSGNQTLQQTIDQLRGLIAAAQADEANSKKGAQQFQDLVNQYNQQLTQYLDQQQNLMIQLNEATKQLTLPNYGQDYSSYISSLQQVIQQYEQYAGAAQNAAQSLQAAQFLQESLANYAQQWTEQLEQDDITAVQNALQLNELIMQRNLLLQQTAQNERNIMEQGVLTRQQTFAQSKAQQLAQTQLQASLQLEQMNMQIDVAQAQVAAASHVFDLATTRIGLEQQLIQLQSAAADRQMQGVQALANLVAALNSGVNSNNSAIPTQNDFIVQLISMLANNGNNNASSLIGLLSIFQQYASSGLSSGTVLSTY